MNGDIERYSKLRCKESGFVDEYEESCVEKGIIANFEFTKWADEGYIMRTKIMRDCISSAFIMNDHRYGYDTSTTHCIWYPRIAKKENYRELVYYRPDLKYHIARACVIAGYNNFYSEIDPLLEFSLYLEAKETGNQYVLDDIASKMKGDIYIKLSEDPSPFHHDEYHFIDKDDTLETIDLNGFIITRKR